MGCLFRAFQSVVLGVLGVALLLVALGLDIVGTERRRLGDLARQAPIMTIERIAEYDGAAWVKGQLLPASTTQVIMVGSQASLLSRITNFRRTQRDVRRDGAWEQRFELCRFPESRREVPTILQDGGFFLTFDNWLGIDVGEELLIKRGDIAQLQRLQVQREALASAPDEITLENFLPVGTECWGFGHFQRGKPQVLEDGAFYLTGLEPEKFAAERGRIPGHISKIFCGLLVCGLLFSGLGLRALLKGLRVWSEDRSPPESA